ncbi:MAG: hypothetical protein IT210_18760 [Armatimonadetes bacterium]|nr:hypothetical protein [Armatimonadota bacterium]
MTPPPMMGLMAAASPMEVGTSEAAPLLAALSAAFEAEGTVQAIPYPDPVTDPDRAAAAGRFFADRRIVAVTALAASWFEDYLLSDMLEEYSVPAVLWARPGMETGSLCGMQQAAFLLKALDRPCRLLFAPPGCPDALARALCYVRAAGAARWLRRARIGLLGRPVEGMAETAAPELTLRKRLGPRVVGLDTARFLASACVEATQALRPRWAALARSVGNVCVPEEAGIESLQVYSALKRWIVAAGLSAVAAGCYPHLMGKVCLAASLLGEEGVPIACEGDVNGAVGMALLTHWTGRPARNTDLLDPVPEESALVFSHCGSGGFSLAERPADIELAPVRLMDTGLCCRFPARPGPVTLLNLVPGGNTYRLNALYGEALPAPMRFPGNPLQVRFASDYQAILAWIAGNGIGPLDGRLRRPPPPPLRPGRSSRPPVPGKRMSRWKNSSPPIS